MSGARRVKSQASSLTRRASEPPIDKRRFPQVPACDHRGWQLLEQ